MIKLKDILNIDEATRQEIQQNYGGPASTNPNISVKPIYVDTKNKTIDFLCIDSNGSRRPQTVKIQMTDHKYLSRDRDLLSSEKISLALLDGELKYSCTCESYKYAFAYVSNTLKSSLVNEPRKPIIRNPAEEGLTCKHIKAVADELEDFIEPITNGFIESTRMKKYGKVRIK